MNIMQVLVEVEAVKERINRLSSDTETANTGPQEPLTREAAKAVRVKFLAASASLDEAACEITRMLGAQLVAGLDRASTPEQSVKVLSALGWPHFLEVEERPETELEPEDGPSEE